MIDLDRLDRLASDYGRQFLRMHRLIDRRMAEHGASLSRTKLLLYLVKEAGDARAADIAEFFGLAPRTVTEAIDGLERDGFVVRTPDPVDRRVKRLSITQEGRRAVEATEPLRLDLVEQIFGALDRDEADQLEQVLAKLGVALSVQEGGAEDSTLFRGIAVVEEKL